MFRFCPVWQAIIICINPFLREHLKVFSVRMIIITHRLCFLQSDTHLLLSLRIMTRIYFKKRECEDRHVSCSALGFSVAVEKKRENTFRCPVARGMRECVHGDL